MSLGLDNLMFDGRVDILPMSGRYVSVRTQINGVHLTPEKFLELARSRLQEINEAASFFSELMRGYGFDLEIKKETVSIIGEMILFEKRLISQHNPSRYGDIEYELALNMATKKFDEKRNRRELIASDIYR